MKKLIVVVITLAGIIGLIFLGVNSFQQEKSLSEREKMKDSMPRMEYRAYLIREVYPTDIIWFGDLTECELRFRSGLKKRLQRKHLQSEKAFDMHTLLLMTWMEA